MPENNNNDQINPHYFLDCSDIYAILQKEMQNYSFATCDIKDNELIDTKLVGNGEHALAPSEKYLLVCERLSPKSYPYKSERYNISIAPEFLLDEDQLDKNKTFEEYYENLKNLYENNKLHEKHVIVIPVNSSQRVHWFTIAIEFSLKKNTANFIYIHDSLKLSDNNDFYEKSAKKLSSVYSKIFTCQKSVSVESIFMQSDSSSCGLFTALAMVSIINGSYVPSIGLTQTVKRTTYTVEKIADLRIHSYSYIRQVATDHKNGGRALENFEQRIRNISKTDFSEGVKESTLKKIYNDVFVKIIPIIDFAVMKELISKFIEDSELSPESLSILKQHLFNNKTNTHISNLLKILFNPDSIKEDIDDLSWNVTDNFDGYSTLISLFTLHIENLDAIFDNFNYFYDLFTEVAIHIPANLVTDICNSYNSNNENINFNEKCIQDFKNALNSNDKKDELQKFTNTFFTRILKNNNSECALEWRLDNIDAQTVFEAIIHKYSHEINNSIQVDSYQEVNEESVNQVQNNNKNIIYNPLRYTLFQDVHFLTSYINLQEENINTQLVTIYLYYKKEYKYALNFIYSKEKYSYIGSNILDHEMIKYFTDYIRILQSDYEISEDALLENLQLFYSIYNLLGYINKEIVDVELALNQFDTNSFIKRLNQVQAEDNVNINHIKKIFKVAENNNEKNNKKYKISM